MNNKIPIYHPKTSPPLPPPPKPPSPAINNTTIITIITITTTILTPIIIYFFFSIVFPIISFVYKVYDINVQNQFLLIDNTFGL